MAKERNRRKKDVPELTIFEEKKKAKVSAKKALELAKEQEAEKLKTHHWVFFDGGKRMVLKPNTEKQ